MSGEFLPGKGTGVPSGNGNAVGAGDRQLWRAWVGDAGVFHERAFSLCRSPVGTEEQNGLGGVSDFLCKLWGNPFITPKV